MTSRQQARNEIAAICGNRHSLTEGERETLYAILGTPTFRKLFPTLAVEELWTIADAYLAEPPDPRRPVSRRPRPVVKPLPGVLR